MWNCIEQNECVVAVGVADAGVYAIHADIILVQRQGFEERARIN